MAEMVGDQIQAIEVMLEDPRGDMGEETLAQKLDSMFDNYVTADQSETHMAAHGQSESVKVESLIEMF